MESKKREVRRGLIKFYDLMNTKFYAKNLANQCYGANYQSKVRNQECFAMQPAANFVPGAFMTIW